MKSRGDTGTLDLLAWQPPRVAAGFDEAELRGGDLASRIARAVALALKRCPLSREDVAQRISDHLGQRVSRATLDAYAAEGKPQHRITLERFIALVEVTGCVDLLAIAAEPFDHAVVPARFVKVIRLHQLTEHEAEIAELRAALAADVRRSK